jgi:hypothetical protein
MSLKLNSSGGGSITLQEPSTASNRTLTLPDNTGNLISSADSGTVTQGMIATGVAGKGPAFRAYRTTNQSVSNAVFTKIQFDAENFDTNNCYDSTSNYRFTPNVAGYYQVNAGCYFTSLSTRPTEAQIALYKNGAAFASVFLNLATANQLVCLLPLTALVDMNGTTDYIEIYGYLGGGSNQIFAGGGQFTYFDACLARAA